MTTKNIKENLGDHLAVQQLVARYTAHINQREWEAVWSLFTEDAEWNAVDFDGNHVQFQGKKQLSEGIYSIVSPAEMLVQIIHSTVIDIDGDSATALSTVHETYRASADQGFIVFGTYYDDAVLCADGEWRFQRRAFRPTYYDSKPPLGKVLTTFPTTSCSS